MSTAKTNRQLPSINPIQKLTTKSVKSEVVFGTPSDGCQGVGICRIIASGLNVQYKCPKVAAVISMTAEGKIKMKFSKASMQPRFMKRHFRWLLFQVLEPYSVPDNVLRKMSDQTTPYIIMPGIYQVWETKEWMIVEF